MSPRILVHGHRGARARRPENTLSAFQYAIERGVDVLELDVAVTKDNLVVVTHDLRIDGTICSGPVTNVAIRALTLSQLREYDCGTRKNPLFPMQISVPGERVPTLDEVFELGKSNGVQFNVETKLCADRPELTPDPDAFARMILESICKSGLEQRVFLQSFDPRALRAMKKLNAAIPRGALFETQNDWQALARAFEATILGPEFNLVTAERVEQAHAAGLLVVPWTANEPADWAKLADARVDAIISDDPESLMAWLRERGLR